MLKFFKSKANPVPLLTADQLDCRSQSYVWPFPLILVDVMFNKFRCNFRDICTADFIQGNSCLLSLVHEKTIQRLHNICLMLLPAFLYY